MANYVISDLHGQYDAYRKMLDKIRFSEEDVLYVLGDVLDRGPHPVKIMQDLMQRPNVVCIAGNHEAMALECLKFLNQEITEENILELTENPKWLGALTDWTYNGGGSTIAEYAKLSQKEKKAVWNFLLEFDLYKEVEAGGNTYLLVHAGLRGFSPKKPIWRYELDDLVWGKTNYKVPYFQDKFVVTGHTPTMLIPDNPRPGYIYRNQNHIAIDCGVTFGGRLGCLCLDTGEEFYI